MSRLVNGMSAFLYSTLLPHVLIEKPGLRVERRAEPVCRAIIVRIDECPFRRGDCRRIKDGAASLIKPVRPILSRKLLAQEKLAGQPIQHVVKAVPVGEQHYLPWTAAEVGVQ